MESGKQQFSSYEPRLISILEVLAAYFVDVFFNHIYSSARTGQKTGGSLTDEYVRRVQAYVVGVKTDEQCYRQIVQDLHAYFRKMTRYATLSFADFVERIVQQFIPSEYYDLLKLPEKDESLGSIIADLVSGIAAYVTSPDIIWRLIDEHDHNPQVTIRMVQDQSVTILLGKRGEIHNSFLRRIGQAKDTVSMDVVEDLKAAIRKLVKQKADLKSLLGETEERVMELEDEVAGFKKREAKFRKLVQMMQAEREYGQPAAAHAATVPPRNSHAEPDPLDFRHQTEPPRRERIAEVIPTTRDANFFAPPIVSAATRRAAEGSVTTRRAAEGFSPFADAPPEAIGGRAPDMRATQTRRRAANISEFINDTDASDDEDSQEKEKSQDSDG